MFETPMTAMVPDDPPGTADSNLNEGEALINLHTTAIESCSTEESRMFNYIFRHIFKEKCDEVQIAFFFLFSFSLFVLLFIFLLLFNKIKDIEWITTTTGYSD